MPDRKDAPGAISRFDGRDLRAMFSTATRLFESSVETINALNVFPVPDGDTGTNMFLTLREVVKQADAVRSDSAAQVAAAMARGALYEARGNSGVILCQFFKGVAVELEGREDFGVPEMVSALRSASVHAYRAVGEPVEGTMLTVIRSVAEAAQRSAESGEDLGGLVDAVCRAATETVALTPTMLPILREAGVVDAGGHGMAVILEGVRLYVTGGEAPQGEIPPPTPVGVDKPVGAVSAEFLASADERLYGYCTQLMIQGVNLDLDSVRKTMASVAGSTAVVGDDTLIKVHVHIQDPGPIISQAISIGTLSQVKIENMDEQHREYSLARRIEAKPGPRESGASVAVVAVAWGEGLQTVFTDFGAAEVVVAGDTMNPSVQEIVHAVEATQADSVIFLPNHENIVPTAQRAAEVSTSNVRVVPSTSIPQGIAAILAFQPDKGLEDNLTEMERLMKSVRTGQVCEAIRPVQLRGISVREGQIIGLLQSELVVSGDEANEVLMALLRVANLSEGDLVTLYWGGPLSSREADAADRCVREAFPGAEVEVVSGGQPYYHYIVSIEEDTPWLSG